MMRHNLSKNMMHVANGLRLNKPLKRCGKNEVHLAKSYIILYAVLRKETVKCWG